MIEAARAAGIHLLVGHSHSFDLPYLAHARADRQRRVRRGADDHRAELHRLPLSPAPAGGARHRAGRRRVLQPGAAPGRDRAPARRRPRRAACAPRPASGTRRGRPRAPTPPFSPSRTAPSRRLTYSGYGHFDTDELHGWIGETRPAADAAGYGAAAPRSAPVDCRPQEAALKNRRAYGTTVSAADCAAAPPPPAHNHFGLVVVSCERGDLRPMPNGVEIYADAERRFEPLPAAAVPRAGGDRRTAAARPTADAAAAHRRMGRWRRWRSASPCCNRRGGTRDRAASTRSASDSSPEDTSCHSSGSSPSLDPDVRQVLPRDLSSRTTPSSPS